MYAQTQITFHDQITDAMLRIKRKEQSIADAEYELNLLKNDVAEITNRQQKDLIAYYLSDASKWIHMRDKVDKRKSYPEKAAFECVKSKLHEYTFGASKEIIEVCTYGINSYAWEIAFSVIDDYYQTQIYRLEIPNYGRLDYEAVMSSYGGQYSLYSKDKPDGCVYTAVWRGYQLERLADYFRKDEDNGVDT